MQLQHVNVKLLVENPEAVDLEPLIPIFHGWIQDQAGSDLLLDIADYRHVQAGPGVILIGHEGDYSVDNTDNRLGVRYNRKAPLDGSNQDRLTQAARAVLTACQRLEADPRLDRKLRFNGREIEIFLNDRLIAPNCDETREALHSDFQFFAQHLFHGGDYSLAYPSDRRRLFGVSLKSAERFSVTDLLETLA
jgi:hypothetical protein